MMKFAALLKKELRICLPWLVLAAVIFAGFGAIIMKDATQRNYINRGYNIETEEMPYAPYETPYVPISGFGPLILIISSSLGAILAICQFLLPDFFKTWAFTIHRSIKPNLIIWTKLLASGLTFILSIGLLWTLFYRYAAEPGRFHVPIFLKTYLEGWIYIMIGAVAYLGTAMAAISTTHWYTTRLLGVAIAFAIFCIVITSISLLTAFLWIAVGVVFMGIQIFYTFLTREY